MATAANATDNLHLWVLYLSRGKKANDLLTVHRL
jgi:hypothetical protein